MMEVASAATKPPVIRLWMLYVGLAATLTIIAVAINRHTAKHDYHIWFDAGQNILHGRDIYDVRPGQQLEFMYPPTAAYLLAPTTIAGEQVMTAILAISNSLALGVSVLLSVYLTTGRPFGRTQLVYIIPVVLAIPHVWEMFILGQPNLFLLALMLGGFACLRLNRHFSAGLLIALAAAVKAFPVTAIVYLVYRRYWTAALSAVVGIALFVVILPAPIRGLNRSIHDLRVWTGQMVKVDAGEIGQRAERSFSWQNQSLLGVVHRYVRHVDANRSRKGEYYINFIDISAKQANRLVLALGGLIGIAYVLLLPTRRSETNDTRAVEWAMLLVLMLIASPYYFSYYSVWLIFPYTVLVDATGRAVVEGRRPVAAIPLVACPILFILSVQAKAFWYPQFLGNILWGDLLILVILGWELRRRIRTLNNQRAGQLIQESQAAPASSTGGVALGGIR